MDTSTPDLRATIKSIARDFDLPWELIEAFATVESSLNPWALRYEPQYKYLYLLDDRSHLSPTERVGQMCSWGLMQVMGAVAREHGFKGYFPQLCDPIVGLRYGCLHVTKFRAKYGQWSDVIAAYNAGSPRREPTNPWSYVNQFYVNKVLTVWNGLEVPIPLKETEI